MIFKVRCIKKECGVINDSFNIHLQGSSCENGKYGYVKINLDVDGEENANQFNVGKTYELEFKKEEK